MRLNPFLLFTFLIYNVNSQVWYQADLLDDSEGYGIYSLKYSPDGTKLARGGSDNLIRIYDVRDDNTVLQTLEGHTDSVWTLAFSPNSRKLLSGGWDDTLRIWDVDSGVLLKTKELTDWVWSARYSPDGKKIVAGTNDGYLRVWDVVTMEMVLEFDKGSNCNSVDYHPDGKSFVYSSSRNQILDAFDYRVLGDISYGGAIYDLAFNPDGNRLATAGSDNIVRVWDTTTYNYKLLETLYHAETVRSVDFNHDGTLLASSGNDDVVKLWNVDGDDYSLHQTLTGHSSNVVSVDFDNTGTLLASASYDGTIRVWSVPSASPTVSPAPTIYFNEAFIRWTGDKIPNEGFLVGSICSFYCTEYNSAQSFIAPRDGEITSVKVGMSQSSTFGYYDPSGDDITVSINEDNGNNEPGDEIAYADEILRPDNLPYFPEFQVKTSSFSGIVNIREGERYWVKYATEYYYGGGMAFLVGEDNNPGPGYTDGEVKTQSGPGWPSRNNADIFFKVTYRY